MPASGTSPADLRPAGAVRTRLTALMLAAGFPDDAAAALVRHALWSDAAGIPNQGIWRLPQYLAKLTAGGFAFAPMVATDCGPSLCRLDGGDTVGHLVCETASDLAAARAAGTGLGLCLASRSNHIGAAGYYVDRLLQQGLLAVVVSNGPPRNAGPRSGAKLLGNDVLAIGIEGADGPVAIDMTVGAIAGSKLMLLREAGEAVPEGALDARGKGTEARTATLATAGGHKGFALGIGLELLTGALAGGATLTAVQSMINAPERPAENSQMVLAIEPGFLGDRQAVTQAVERMADTLSEAGEHVPGRARMLQARARLAGEIALGPAQFAALQDIAAVAGTTLDPVLCP